MQIRAAVLSEMGRSRPYSVSRPLEIVPVRLEHPGPGEVLIRMRAAGLCHSDLSVIDGNRPRPMPMVLGHEGSGVVEAIGDGVRDLSVGDHVVLVFVPSCGRCPPCDHGRPALCEPGAAANGAGTLLSGARRLHRGGDINHHLGVSAFAEYATVSATSCVKVDSDLPADHAALFGCAVITGVGAVMNTARMDRGSSAAVVGLGGVGLAALLGARRQDASCLIAIDLSDEKLAHARTLGATHTFNASDPECADQVREATRGGVSFAFEMAGSTRALDLSWRITRRGGTTVTAGLPHPDQRLSIPHVQAVAEERVLKGSYLGGCIPSRDIPTYVDWFRRGELPVDALLTDRIALEEINAGFDRLADGQSVRQVVVFE